MPIHDEQGLERPNASEDSAGDGRFLAEILHVFRHPVPASRRAFQFGSISRTLAIGLVMSWLGAIGSMMWSELIFDSMGSKVFQGTDIAGLMRAQRWLTIGFVVLSPFFSLVGVGLTSLIQKLASNLVTSRNLPISRFLWVGAFALYPAIFQVVPFLGGFVASGFAVYFAVVMLRDLLQISTGRAFFVALSPYILVLTLVLFLLIFGGGMALILSMA